ncbi:uncharacterized protein LOC126838722 [Adelges cooleyi]|uniref:uncharacterized protein LOC126838722 n=1 Tax=Adelges cooleyi TaxID=133065 RepID=UPI00218080FD|nr:uncharacterized protein LOC126838722 [Adelges cooleyi]
MLDMNQLKDGKNGRPDIQEILARMKTRFINEADSDNEEYGDEDEFGTTNVVNNDIKDIEVEKSPDDEIAELMLKLNGQVDEELVASIRSRKKMYETQPEADSTSSTTPDIKVEPEQPELKPRIILTLRTNENKPDSYVSSSNLTDYSVESSVKKPKSNNATVETVVPLKRSSRRSTDSSQSVLKSAIARKEKTFNIDTNSKKKLPTKIKKEPADVVEDPTPIKIEPIEDNLAIEDSKVKENFPDQRKRKKKLFRGGRYNIFKKKSQKDRQRTIKKALGNTMNSDTASFDTSETYSDRHSISVCSDFGTVSNDRIYQDDVDSSTLSNVDIEDNKTNVFNQIARDHNKFCLCDKHVQVVVIDEGKMLCEAEDCVDGRLIACTSLACHLDELGHMPMLRAHVALPFVTLCIHHMKRFILHHSCPRCGRFCSEGIFMVCNNGHFFHIGCYLKDQGCLHCGSSEVHELELRKFVVNKLKNKHRRTTPNCISVQVGRQKLTTENCPPEINSYELTKYLQGLQEEMYDSSRIMYPIQRLYQACEFNDIEKVLSILGAGGNSSYQFKDHNNRTALHVASMYGNPMLVYILLQAGNDPNHTDDKMKTPVRLAAKFGHINVLQLLLKHKGAPEIKDFQGMTSLHLAAKHGRLECCRLIVEKHSSMINWIDNGGWTPLVWACENSHTDVVKFFLSYHPNTRIADDENNVALHWAAISGCLGVVQALVEYDSEVNMVNDAGDTALHIATRKNATDIVLFLLEQGAMAYHRNKSKKRPIDYCLPNTKCYNLLKSVPPEQRKSISVKPLASSKRTDSTMETLLQSANAYVKKTPVIVSEDITHGCEEIPIKCVNEIDDEVPVDFTYIKENCYDVGNYVDSAMSHIASCICEGACNTNACKCVQANGDCLYDENGRLNSEFDYFNPSVILYECNLRCKCHKQRCGNRVIQKGIKVKLELYRHKGMGWGVRARQLIPRGTFVCEYVGEIITDRKANRLKEDSYLFNLENPGATELYCIDALNYSNVARFINHSCDPNLMSVRSFINHHDKRFPRIAFFAVQDIPESEPLSYDYGTAFWKVKSKLFTCKCGKSNCCFSEEAIKNLQIDSDTEDMEYDESNDYDLSEMSGDDSLSQNMTGLVEFNDRQLSEHSGLFVSSSSSGHWSNITKNSVNDPNDLAETHKNGLIQLTKQSFAKIVKKEEDALKTTSNRFLEVTDGLQNKFLESQFNQNKLLNSKTSTALGKKVLITKLRPAIRDPRIKDNNTESQMSSNVLTTCVVRPHTSIKDPPGSIKIVPKQIMLNSKSIDFGYQNVFKISSVMLGNNSSNSSNSSSRKIVEETKLCEKYVENIKSNDGIGQESETELIAIKQDEDDSNMSAVIEYPDVNTGMAFDYDDGYNPEHFDHIEQGEWTTSEASSDELV